MWVKPFENLRANGFQIPFVVRLSNYNISKMGFSAPL